MSRYIDWEWYQRQVKKMHEQHPDVYMPTDGIPFADVVEVVRCKECVHCADDWNGNQPMFTCELAKCGESVYLTDFCSYGERSEDEQIH